MENKMFAIILKKEAMKPKYWILLLIFTFTTYVSIKNAAHFIKTYNNLGNQGIAESTFLRSDSENKILKKLGKKAKAFAIENNYNNSYCFLVNMQLHSGKKRFFIYDLAHDRIVDSGMVSHGSCNNVFLSEVRFSNENGYGCTSEGRYLVGHKYKGRFGNAYKLKGLDATNNNAFRRFVVLHSYTCVPDTETYPLPICNSLGCTMVSNNFLQKLSTIIDQSTKPILLFVF